MSTHRALLIVDLQIDFCPGGALAVPQGDVIVGIINKYIRTCEQKNFLVCASRDWHPAKTTHFKDFGGLWPIHCVQNTPGAAFHPGLRLPKNTLVISKGMDPDKDSYSALQGVTDQEQNFMDFLKKSGITEIFICGLATDYCVKSSCLDAVQNGFQTYLLKDAIKGVDIKPADSKKAIEQMVAVGVQPITVKDLAGLLN